MKEGLIEQLKTQEKFFLNTASCLNEGDSDFQPNEEMYTVAQHVGHAAETVGWFFEGAFGEGFDMNFDNYAEKMKRYTSFDNCVQQFKDEISAAITKVKELKEAELILTITGEIMTGAPKMAIVGAIVDHTAHHRGSLAVYARLLGRKPQMPYGEM
ncbi:MAG: DinB family protein [Bacteroidota bacterium]